MKVGDVIYVIAHKGERIGTIPIIGETSRSWLTSSLNIRPEEVTPTHWAVTKLDKKKLESGELYGYYPTRQQAEDILWMQDHRYNIKERVTDMKDAAILRKIAELIGYKEQA